MGIQAFTGMQASSTQAFAVRSRNVGSSRGALLVVANKKGLKKSQVVLTANVESLGARGDIINVQNGYLKNYLMPQKLAMPATAGMLAQVQRAIDQVEIGKAQIKAKAQAMATALQTIGTIKVQKKVGEKDQIFGSVQASEITDFIEKQTSRKLDPRDVTLPEMKQIGTYTATIKLHPEVTATFKVKVEKLRN